MIVEFLRSDGIGFSAEEGSPAFELMAKDGAFTRLDPADGEPVAAAAESDSTDLLSLTKKQLYEEATLRNVPVTDKMTKPEIIAAIEAHVDLVE